MKPGRLVNTHDPGLQGATKEDYEFKVNLSYTVSSGLARDTQ